MRELIKKMGMPWAGRRSIQMIRDAMRRMSLVGFRIRNLDDNKNVIFEEVFTLISFIKNKNTNGRDGKFQIHLNVALVRMIQKPKNFTKIFLDDLISLKSNAQLIYLQICKMSSGSKRLIKYEESRFIIYGRIRPTEGINTTKSQKNRAMQAVCSIGKLPYWTIVEKRKDGILIRREADKRVRQIAA